MSEKAAPSQAPVIPVPIGDPVENVLGGAGPRGEPAGCPTGLSNGEPVEVKKDPGSAGTEGTTEPDGNALYRRRKDDTAGGEDSSPLETVPSGQKQDAAQQPQNAP